MVVRRAVVPVPVVSVATAAIFTTSVLASSFPVAVATIGAVVVPTITVATPLHSSTSTFPSLATPLMRSTSTLVSSILQRHLWRTSGLSRSCHTARGADCWTPLSWYSCWRNLLSRCRLLLRYRRQTTCGLWLRRMLLLQRRSSISRGCNLRRSTCNTRLTSSDAKRAVPIFLRLDLRVSRSRWSGIGRGGPVGSTVWSFRRLCSCELGSWGYGLAGWPHTTRWCDPWLLPIARRDRRIITILCSHIHLLSVKRSGRSFHIHGHPLAHRHGYGRWWAAHLRLELRHLSALSSCCFGNCL
mmetsp:Transcript_6623/g.7612  ORF Transcript_6623/g.7612 Transcript_6623/m.7612 type:complete len:299 (-) Transcript_6623:1072-1968(-)